jgi:5'-3' exonuclease
MTLQNSTAVAACARRTVLVVDGPSVAHRAYYAYESTNLRLADGSPAWAVKGFLSLFGGIIKMVRPDAIVVGWDGDAAVSHRRALVPTYKANRGERDADLAHQLPRIPELLEQAGFTVIQPQGLEADDVLASVSATCEARQGVDCVVATSDRDSFGLISGRTTVLRLVSGLSNAVWMNPRQLLDEYGLRSQPSQYPDYAALRGDRSDNLPGVPGFGEKTAVKLLAAMGTVEAALADPAGTVAAVGKAAARKLAENEDVWRLNRKIMGMDHTLPVDLPAAARIPSPERVVAASAGFGVSCEPLTAALTILNSRQPSPAKEPAVASAPPVVLPRRRLIPGTDRQWPLTF